MAASVLVKKALTSVIEKAPTVSPHAKRSYIKLEGQELLDKVAQGEAECKAFDQFCLETVKYLKDHLATTAKYKLNSSKRVQLWTEFHKIRLDMYNKPSLLWKELLQCLKMESSDPLLYQSLLSGIFEMLLIEYFQASSSQHQDTTALSTELTVDELNALRYACGYVTRTILKKYEVMSGEVASQYIQCLGDMAVEGEGDNVQAYTKRWFEIVNRGGLYPLNDETFWFFVQVEKKVKYLLPKHVVTRSDKEAFKESVIDKIVQDEDVDFSWTLISQDIYNPDDQYYYVFQQLT